MLFHEHALVAGDGGDDVADFRGFGHGHDAEAIHDGFERFGGIDFGDDDFGARATGAAGKSAAAPAVAGDDEFRSSEQEVGGADDAVDGGLSGAVAIVEKMLGIGVVDGDDGELQHAFLGHGAQANDAGGGLFGSADYAFERVGAFGVKNGDQVSAIVHGDVGLVIDGGHDVLVVSVVVLALDGEDADALIANQAGGNVILCRERIGGAENHVGTAIAQADGEVRRFSRDVQAG